VFCYPPHQDVFRFHASSWGPASEDIPPEARGGES
jgi:hypothetical protein